MTPFQVGMKVVCVDATYNTWNSQFTTVDFGLDGLTEKAVYTVSGIYDFFGRIKLVLEEIDRPLADVTYSHKGFDAARFRPVQKTSIDIFTAMLQPAPKQRETVV